MQTKILSYIIIGILVIAGIAGASWYFVKRQSIPSPAEQPPVVTPPEVKEKVPPEKAPADETANWKIYTSPNNTFTIKYPPQLYETKQWIVNVPIGWKDEGVLSTTRPWNEVFTKDSDFRVEFSLGTKRPEEKLEDFITRTIKEQSGEFYSPKIATPDEKKTIEVDNKQSLWYVGGLGPAVSHIEVYIPKSDTEVVVIALWSYKHPPSLAHQTILNQMLSTFKFLE